MSVDFCLTTQCYIPEDGTLRNWDDGVKEKYMFQFIFDKNFKLVVCPERTFLGPIVIPYKSVISEKARV
jgi:hypothetical protein